MSRPDYGTAPIRCGKRSCKWRGFETDMKKVPWLAAEKINGTKTVCPTCGDDSYMFLTPGEIAAWERAKRKAAAINPTGGTTP